MFDSRAAIQNPAQKEEKIMTKDAIAAIRGAEEQAEVLCRVAGERAAEMRSKIEQEGAAHCASTEAEQIGRAHV